MLRRRVAYGGMFGGLGAPELIVIGVAALLVFGPKRLPELARGLGKGIRDFKKALEGGSSDSDADKALPPAGEEKTDESDHKKEKPPY